MQAETTGYAEETVQKKMFMFSSSFKNERTEEDMIVKNIKANVHRYEETAPKALFA